ncbi:MAG TPA: SDR family oxidoreductase [Iamia sp.]|nr:SDR family oxidoreductase [Iamia sp.]
MPRYAPHPERRPAAVTGASSGIGAAVATQLAEAGHPVVLGARRVERCEDLAATLRAEGHEAAAVPLDLTDPGSIEAFARRAADAHGPLEVFVSNAGEVWPQAVHATDPVTFTRQVQVNLLGAQALVHAVVPGMVDRGRGDVVLVTSDVVRAPRPLMGAYMTAKAGLEGMARAMQMELEGSGVRAGMVRPGPSSTEQGTGWTEEVVVEVVDEWSRWGLIRHDGALRPGDVARAVIAMVSQPRGTHLTLIEVEPEAPSARRTHTPGGSA